MHKHEKPDQGVLDSLGSPNAWTPHAEDRWIEELGKLSGADIYRRFPPIKKPPNVRKRGKTYHWGN